MRSGEERLPAKLNRGEHILCSLIYLFLQGCSQVLEQQKHRGTRRRPTLRALARCPAIAQQPSTVPAWPLAKQACTSNKPPQSCLWKIQQPGLPPAQPGTPTLTAPSQMHLFREAIKPGCWENLRGRHALIQSPAQLCDLGQVSKPLCFLEPLLPPL